MVLCYYCTDCFHTIKAFVFHYKIKHSTEKKFFCAENNCARSFSSFLTFKRHIEKHFRNSEEIANTDTSSLKHLPTDTDTNIFSCNEYSENNYSIPSLDNRTDFLPQFKENLQNRVKYYVSGMLNNSLVPRNFVHHVIAQTNMIFCRGMILDLKKIVQDCLFSGSFNIPSSTAAEINDFFSVCENAFENFETEHKSFKFFQKCGEYIPPNDFIIGYKNVFQKVSNGDIQSTRKAVKGKIIPVRQVLKKLFEKEGVLISVEDNITCIKSSEVYINYIQGDLWKSLSNEYTMSNKTVFPLFLFFDDFQIGNALGSHTDTNKIGAVYYSIPCLPQNLFASLKNIFLFALFYSKDRKEFGNEATFSEIISELKFLQEEGIIINVNNGDKKIYFKLALIIGDNLGIHSILGLSESFSCTYNCRFCKITKSESQITYSMQSYPIRTKQSYNDDVVLQNISVTGIKEKCVWHNLPGFHLTSNFMVDIMHDLLEGICVYDLTALLSILVLDYKLFTVEDLNNRIKSFNFGNDISNTPPFINIRCLKSHLKMSANEMLTFVRYLGVLIGDYIPVGLEIWEIWITLIGIIDVVTAPSLQFSESKRLKVKIEDYLQLVIKYFQHLKPKHHHMLHYSMVLNMSGPLVHLWGMRFEQKHRDSKLSSNVSGSFKNMIHTLANKAQLKLCHQLIAPCKEDVLKESSLIDSTDRIFFFPDFCSENDIYVLRNVEISGVCYKKNSVIILDYTSIPIFGTIDKIFLHKNGATYFSYTELVTLHFDRHVHAFEVCLPNLVNNKLVKHSDLHDYIPCVLSKLKTRIFISLKYLC